MLDAHGNDPAALAQARALLAQVLRLNPDHSQAYVELARYHLKAAYESEIESVTGALLSANEELHHALQVDPRNADAYVLQGVVFTDQQRYEEAIDVLGKAQSLGTNNPWLYINYSGAYIRLGQWDKAAKSLTSLERSPYRAQWPAGIEKALADKLITIHRHNGDVAGTAKAFHQRHLLPGSSDLSSMDEHALFLLGGKNDPVAAINEANRVLAQYPDDRHARQALGLAKYAMWDRLRLSDAAAARRFWTEAQSSLSDHGDTLVATASWLGVSPVLQHLVLALRRKGFSLDARDSNGTTALVCAIGCGTPISVPWLLKNGANPNVADANGITPLMWAIDEHDQRSFDLLLAHRADVNTISQYFHRAALYEPTSNGEVGMVAELLARHANVDEPAAAQDTPLMNAAGAGSSPMVQMLLDAGASASLVMDNGQSAADIAEFNHHPELAAQIRSHASK